MSRIVGLSLVALSLAPGAARADAAKPVEALAETMARELSKLCPPAPRGDVAAHEKCAAGLRDATFIPWATTGLLWGAEQKNLRISKWPLTHFTPSVYQLMYLSLFSFTGKWSVDQDPREHVTVIHLEAYFRNAMPPGEYPYPFWHSAAKWGAYEATNELKFFLTSANLVFVTTRSNAGSEAARGEYAQVIPPAFDGNWQWTDSGGHPQPHVSLFANKYGAGNPFLPVLDKTYKAFAIQARNGTCYECHTPENKATADHLVLLQTPMHASGEINRALKDVRDGKMPEDELGQPKGLDPKLRAAILQTGEEFRDTLAKADRWEATQPHTATR